MNDIVPFSGWTPERIDELKAYAAEGLTAAQIAYRMKPITELAVIGRAARLGIALGIKPPKGSPQRRSRGEPEAAPPAREDAWLPLPGREPVDLLELSAEQCPWPIGGNDGGGSIGCCGAPKGVGLPYCKDHTALAYDSGRYRRPRGEVNQYVRSNERRYA